MGLPGKYAGATTGQVNKIGNGIPDATNILAREATTCAGNAAAKILQSRMQGAIRSGVELHNCSTLYDLWVRPVPIDGVAPTISITDKNYTILPGATLLLEYGSDIDIYVQNSSGAATTSNFTATEVRR